jgi:2,4-dienoyl-CoA reductase-like NADH-dependent reductase (Old Yellow Enzyme family)
MKNADMLHPSNTDAASRTKDPLLQEFRIRNLRLKNRIMSTAHASGLDDSGMPGERYQRYHEEKARGGLALTMFGGSSMISQDSSWGGGQIDMSTDRIIPYLQQFSERIHAHGAAIMVQASHLGRRADSMAMNWLPTIAPSPIREARHRNIPREMDREDIDRVISDWAAAARRAREGGLDGMETLTSGHLIGQFLSPRTNRRNDEFGGSLAKRARFAVMVHEALRKAAGDDFVIGIRYVIDEMSDDGISAEEGLEVARILQSEGHIDFFNVIFGLADSNLPLAEKNMPGMFVPSGRFLAPVAAFRREVSLPVFHAARVSDVATARYAVASGAVDMIGMTRAHMADPQIVNKIMRGEEDRIRPCVGASYCMYKKVACIHNPASGRETILPQLVGRSARPGRRIAVVGGGPAGLEAARVSAERGHEVILWEALDQLGGQVNVAARTSLRRELSTVINWRAAELERLGVDIRLGIYAEAGDILAETPDAVIVATGGMPDLSAFPGHELCSSVWDILAAPATAAREVLVYDVTGRPNAASCALELLEKGHKVQFVTPDEQAFLEMAYSDRIMFRKRLAEHHTPAEFDLELLGVTRRENLLCATLRHLLTGEIVERLVPQVIIENGTLPLCEVFDELRGLSTNGGRTDIDRLLAGRPQVDHLEAGQFELHRIGDAVTSRSIHSAIYDALRLCKDL